MPSARRIGVFLPLGNQNLGDEAIIAAVIQNIRLRNPSAEICAFTVKPSDTRQRHQVPAYPIRRVAPGSGVESRASRRGSAGNGSALDWPKRLAKKVPAVYRALKAIRGVTRSLGSVIPEAKFLVSSYRCVNGLDLFVISGSQQLIDSYGGPWAAPYTLLTWCVLARLGGARIAFVSVGAGPLGTGLGRRFVTWALKCAAYRSFRDPSSLELAEELRPGGNGLVPDLVFGWDPPRPAVLPVAARPVVGINPLPYFDGGGYWYKSEPGIYRDYVRRLATLAEFLIDRGYAVWLFPTQLLVDPQVIEDVEVHIGPGRDDGLVRWPVRSFEDLLGGIAASEMIVATRYHGILMSLLLGKAVVALAYHRKSRDLMTMMGQSGYVVDAGDCDSPRLIERFLSLESARTGIEREIRERLPAIRQRLFAQFDEVLGASAAAVQPVVMSVQPG